MKKTVSVFVIVIMMFFAVFISCKKNNPGAPSATNTATPVITPDTSLYGFENGTNMNWVTVSGGITRTASTTERAYRGTHSLRLDGTFDGVGCWVGVTPPSVTNMVGKKIIIHIYIPSDSPGAAGAVFAQDGSGWCWERGPWIPFPKGQWTTVAFELALPESTCGSATDDADIHRIGIQFQPGSTYSGSVYIDSVELVAAGTPTYTPTVTSTITVSPTITVSETPGGPTRTDTDTATETFTITPTHTAISTPIPPNDPAIQYYGRWNLSNPLDPKNGWGTTYIVAGFSGTSVSIKLNAYDVWYAYGIDDFSDHSTFTKFRVRNGRDSKTSTVYTITGLADTTHSIMVVRRTEGTGGVNDFYGFGLDTGKTLSSPGPRPTRKMEIIGDSITCGAVNETVLGVPTATADLPCEWGGCVENGDETYGMQLARLYNAEGRTISRGGIGMFRNCPSCTPNYTMHQIYPYMYFEASPSAASLPWDFASWQADVVVVALGTNDFSAGDPGSANFEGAYSNFLTELRTHYPNAYILCTEPLPSWVASAAGTYISTLVAAKADPKIFYVPINHPPIAAGFPLLANEYAGDTTHPLIAAHTKLANALKTWIDANIYSGLVANNGW